MSIDLNWDTLTSGPDGDALADSIRDFIHTKFQSVPLPRFIKSVTVHEFQFGSVPPELELKDITDPLPDFYEENGGSSDEDDEDDDDDDDGLDDGGLGQVPDGLREASERRRRAAAAVAVAAAAAIGPGYGGGGGMGASGMMTPGGTIRPGQIYIPGLRNLAAAEMMGSMRSASPGPAGHAGFLGVGTPGGGIPGGTSNLHYFHSQFATGALSGTQTPLLAAAANAQLFGGGGGQMGWEGMHHSASSPALFRGLEAGSEEGRRRGHGRNTSIGSNFSGIGGVDDGAGSPGTGGAGGGLLREKGSVSTLAPTSAGTSRPPTRDEVGKAVDEKEEEEEEEEGGGRSGRGKSRARFREPKVEDMQAVFRIKYAGDVRLLLTADILLDYPMPSFVGIPLRLSITGLTFDGVGVLAKIRKRAHFCFLSPEDAMAAVGGEENKADGETRRGSEGGKMGGLLQEIRVESEIGQREGGKTSLKNVGKVERFVLEQVRRIFEEEFVYPSFWTFLV